VPLFSTSKEPVDPNYAKFRDGWSTWIIDKEQYPGLRWAPGTQLWGAWLPARWDFIDFGVIEPPSPLKREWKFEPTPRYEWDWSSSPFASGKLPDLWKQVTDVYNRYKASRPAAVWNPYDGSWRELRARPKPVPEPEPVPTPNPKPPRDQEFHRRAQQLYDDYKAGLITERVYQIRYQALKQEYS